MPAVFDSLVKYQELTPHKAWRIAYVIPFIVIVFVALGMLLTCEDTPSGKWSERSMLHVVEGSRPEHTGGTASGMMTPLEGPPTRPESKSKEARYKEESKLSQNSDLEIQMLGNSDVEAIKGEIIVAPSSKEMMYVICSLPTMALAAQYACSFGSELALNSILASYYAENFPHLGQTKCGQWAAMFGLLNFIFRPLGGFISDKLYLYTKSVWAKKLWLLFLGVVTGAFMIAIGVSNPKNQSTIFGLFAGLAFFLEAANGANFSLVPHVYPAANGKPVLKSIFHGLYT